MNTSPQPPTGIHVRKIGNAISDCIASFKKVDMNSLSGGWKSFMRIRVVLDVTKPLKRRMKLKRVGRDWSWADFCYERLPNFCFICELLGHTDRFCQKIFEEGFTVVADKPYGAWLRVASHRNQVGMGQRWLISEDTHRGTLRNRVQYGVSTLGVGTGMVVQNSNSVREHDPRTIIGRDVEGIFSTSVLSDVEMVSTEKTIDKEDEDLTTLG